MNPETGKKTLVIARQFDLPIEIVWKGWTDPSLVMQWWGPAGYSSPQCVIDLREGGRYLFCMRAPQEQGGMDYYSTGVYSKIVPHERLMFTQHLSDKAGNPLHPSQVGMPPDFPERVDFDIAFKSLGDGKSELVITESGWTPGQMAHFAVLGMEQSLDKFAARIRA